MSTKRIEGIVPVMITPYLESGEIDYAGLERLIEWYIAKGSDALFAVCQSSEMQFLTIKEVPNWESSSSSRRRGASRSSFPGMSATILTASWKN